MVLIAVALGAAAAPAQELATQPTPFTALVDFTTWERQPAKSLPIWLESVQIVPANTAAPSNMGLPEQAAEPHTLFRIRLRSIPGLSSQLFLRLFFDDLPGKSPTVSAWSDTQGCRFTSNPLGAGLDLPASETLAVPIDGVNYLEIDASGDGKNIRKALLSPLKTTTASASLDFAPPSSPTQPDPVLDPFGNDPSTPSPKNDLYLFGRIRATLEPGIVKLSFPAPQPPTTAQTGTNTEDRSQVSYEFNLEAAPLLCFVAFEISNADPLAPLQAFVNDQSLGPVVPQYPDLADPAYIGQVRPLQTMRFQYSGWLHAQVVIPGSSLKTGTNTLTFQLSSSSAPTAIRAVELQLKNNWQNLDYNIAP
ncbi:MAG: hypothetical protein ACFUZC_15225 [Chthoniobacteraceae bacterium]